MSELAVRLEVDDEGRLTSDPFPAKGSWTFTGMFEAVGSWWARFEREEVEDGTPA